MDIYCTEAEHFRASWPLPWVWSAISKLRQHWALWIQEWWIFFIFFGILPFILLSSPVTTCRPCWTELISSSWELLCLFQSPDPRNNIFQLGLLTFTHWVARQKSPGFDNTAWLSCDFNFVVLPTVGLFFFMLQILLFLINSPCSTAHFHQHIRKTPGLFFLKPTLLEENLNNLSWKHQSEVLRPLRGICWTVKMIMPPWKKKDKETYMIPKWFEQ